MEVLDTSRLTDRQQRPRKSTWAAGRRACCWKTVNLHLNLTVTYRTRCVCPLKLACIGAPLWLLIGSERMYIRGLWHRWGCQECGLLTGCVRAEADWYRLPRGRLRSNISRASLGIWAGDAGVMVEVSDGKQWRIAGVLLLDLLCGRALHVVLVGASVIEPENRMTWTKKSHFPKGKRWIICQDVERSLNSFSDKLKIVAF